MTDFNVYDWKDKQRQVRWSQKTIHESISIDIPENTGYEDFARAVADILKNDYGTHNFQPFLKTLTSLLNQKSGELEEALSSTPVEEAEGIVQDLKGNVSTNSNIPPSEKQALLSSFDRLASLLDEIGYEIEGEVDRDIE